MDASLSPRRRTLIVALGAATLGSACAPRRDGLRFEGQTMGSTYSVRIAGAPSTALDAARAAVEDAFGAVVAAMSTFDARSEVGRFNRHRSTAAVALSPATMDVLRSAQMVASQSAGAFDVTVAPLVAAWGFGAGAVARDGSPDLASAPVGWQHLALEEQAARKRMPGLQIDLSAIAKGYAVDRAALALESLGVQRYMVEAGGEIRTRGLNAAGRPWQIAIEKPDAWPQQVLRIVPMQDLSIATSGDYRNCYERDGQRIHHEIDPATRAPATGPLASVSVLHDRCMLADAWATALFVQGTARGLATAQAQGLAALFIVRDGSGRFREIASPAFAALAA